MNDQTEQPNSAAQVQLQGVKKSYDSSGESLRILDGLNLEMPKGEILIISGESGSGKTTFLNILGGLDTADGGSIRVAETEVSRLKENELYSYRQKHLGFIFQFHHLLKDFSALENVMMPALISGRNDADARQGAQELLSQLGLAERLNNYPYQLSGGERQRVAIARALINSPDLILADEPTGSLDEKRSREIEEILFELVRSQSKTMIIVTHDKRLARQGDRHLVLTSGALE